MHEHKFNCNCMERDLTSTQMQPAQGYDYMLCPLQLHQCSGNSEEQRAESLTTEYEYKWYKTVIQLRFTQSSSLPIVAYWCSHI